MVACVAHHPRAREVLLACCDGYFLSPSLGVGVTSLMHVMIPSADDFGEQGRGDAAACTRLMRRFLANERFFAGLVGGNETQIIANFPGEAEELLALLVAHYHLADVTESARAQRYF